MLPDLSFAQYELVRNALNLTIAVLGGASLLFILAQSQVSSAYRLAVSLMAVVVGMACYHYVRIFDNWTASYALKGDIYAATGVPFNYAYRYADWLGTVPLILAALVLVLDLGRAKSSSLITRMVVAAVLMIALGYVGELQTTDMTQRAVWGFFSTLPFVYILWILWGEMAAALQYESPRVRQLFGGLRLLLLASWGFYPIVYMFPMFGLSGAEVQVGVQVGNSIADITAKALFGLLIFSVAREKTLEDEGQSEELFEEIDFGSEEATQPVGR